MKQRRVTIRDVARAAGVSTTTVSDALSGRGRLSGQTRDRVVAVAAELGYVASSAARSLRLGRSGALGLYVPDRTVGFEYYMHLARGAAEEAMEHGLALTLLPPWEDPERLGGLHLDGLIVADPTVGDPVLKTLSAMPVPLVTCERDMTPGAQHAGMVRSDHTAGMTELLDHLAERGAGSVGLLCPGEDTAFGWEIRRACDTREDLHVRIADVPLACSVEDVADAVDSLLTSQPDAVVAVPDGAAMSTLHQLVSRGLRVPDDMLVASYVDAPTLRMTNPPLTGVDLFPRQVGREAVATVAGKRGLRRDIVIPTELNLRASTAGS